MAIYAEGLKVLYANATFVFESHLGGSWAVPWELQRLVKFRVIYDMYSYGGLCWQSRMEYKLGLEYGFENIRKVASLKWKDSMDKLRWSQCYDLYPIPGKHSV
jgi:hypothetical protein